MKKYMPNKLLKPQLITKCFLSSALTAIRSTHDPSQTTTLLAFILLFLDRVCNTSSGYQTALFCIASGFKFPLH